MISPFESFTGETDLLVSDNRPGGEKLQCGMFPTEVVCDWPHFICIAHGQLAVS